MRKDGGQQVGLPASIVEKLLVKKILHEQRSQKDKPFIHLDAESKSHSHRVTFQLPRRERHFSSGWTALSAVCATWNRVKGSAFRASTQPIEIQATQPFYQRVRTL